MFLYKSKNLIFWVALHSFLWCILPVFAQSSSLDTFSYEKLNDKIQDVNTTSQEKLYYIEAYYKKAKKDNNYNYQMNALREKKNLLDDEAILDDIVKQMVAIAHESNDIKLLAMAYEDVSNVAFRKRDFQQALIYGLKSEEYYSKANDEYGLYAIKYNLGSLYFYTNQMDKAKVYFTATANYYNKREGNNNLLGYISSLYSLGKVGIALHRTDTVNIIMEQAMAATESLTTKADIEFEQAYLNYVIGANYYLLKDYTKAEQTLLNALSIIKENADYTNEHLIYLYLGKVAWDTGKKEKAIGYFKKIDEFFTQKTFLNYDLREGYDYLIEYYKENGDAHNQLLYTEKLISLNRIFEKEQYELTNALHYQNENKKLEESKEVLRQNLLNNKFNYTLWLSMAAVLILLLVLYAYRQNLLKTKLRQKYELTVNRFSNKREISKMPDLVVKDEKITDVVSASASHIDEHKRGGTTEERILLELQQLEEEKYFLQPVSMKDLAAKLNTNTTTLSKIINNSKHQNFNQYINQLRIDEVTDDLLHKSNLRKLSIQGLAEQYGFGSAKSFNTAFQQRTGILPSYFIEQLELDEQGKK